jgi:hypothetical protein
MPAFAGLQTNSYTWLILAGTMAVWMLSLRLVPGWASEGWPSVLKSLYGLAWLGFGLDIVLRFLMLSYNAVEWGNGTPRLMAQTAETVNGTLAYCGLFWFFVALAYGFAVRRRGAGPLIWTERFDLDFAYAAAIPTALFSSLLFFVTDGPSRIPVQLLTPLASVAALYMVPATIVWWDHFRTAKSKWRIGSIQLLVLLPAFIHAWRSPYRENLSPLLLIPLIAALFAGRRPALRKLVPLALICFLVATSLVTSYRRIKWENVRPEEVANEMERASAVEWLTGSWGDQMKRFHSFDSMLLTVRLVPSARPFSGRSVLVAPFIRGFVPRMIYGDKAAADAGERFGSEIWAFDDPMARDHGGAAIAPSMPGDLYDSGGVFDIALGALLWGAVLGLLDGWKGHLPVFCAAAITALLATSCAMSIERDFDHSVAGTIQIVLLLIVVAGLVALARRREPEVRLGADLGGYVDAPNFESRFDADFDRTFDPTPEHS